MRKSNLLLAMLVLASISYAQSLPPLSKLQGKWTGSGRFLDIKWAQEIGNLPIEIKIDVDGGVTGSIGDATLTRAILGTWKEDGFEIRAIIDGSIKTGKKYGKDHFIIFGHMHETEMALNYHLKSNFFFDFTMNVCGVVLRKVN